MLKATKKATLASIKHWEVDGPKGVMMGNHNCALCHRFLRAESKKICVRYSPKTSRVIERCPVYKATGKAGCAGTPFEYHPTKAQVKTMVAFLKSLLPENKNGKCRHCGGETMFSHCINRYCPREDT